MTKLSELVEEIEKVLVPDEDTPLGSFQRNEPIVIKVVDGSVDDWIISYIFVEKDARDHMLKVLKLSLKDMDPAPDVISFDERVEDFGDVYSIDVIGRGLDLLNETKLILSHWESGLYISDIEGDIL